MKKTYPFSCRKHAHDIEFYRNRLFNIMHDMESGEIPMNAQKYDEMYEFYHGSLEDLYNAVCFNTRDGIVSYLTGEQIALAKEIVFWASETRASTLIAAGKSKYLIYC